MKNFWKKLMVATMATGLMLSMGIFAACGDADTPPQGEKPGVTTPGTEKTLESIDVKVPNPRYEKGGTFSTADWTVTAKYSDNTTAPVPLSKCTFTDATTGQTPSLDKSGELTVRVTYEGKTKDVTLTVTSVIRFTTKNGADKDYVYEQNGAGFGDSGYRYADNNAYFTYVLSCAKGSRFATGYFECLVDNEYSIAVSADAQNWFTVGEGATGSSRQDGNEVAFDCEDYTGFAANHGKLYVKFSDANPADGYGPQLHNFTFWYTEETDPNPPAEETVHTLTFDTKGGADEAKWIWNDANSSLDSNGDYRFTDENGKIAYAFDFGSALKRIEITVDIRNQYFIEYSLNGTNWAQGASNTTTSDAFQKAAVRLAEELTGNDGTFYLRFSDSEPAGGMGGAFQKISINYVLADETKYEEPAPVEDELLSIEVTPPTKLSYNVGEELNTAGLEVYGIYQSGSRKAIAQGYTVTGYNKENSGTQTVTVTYEGKTATFEVTVADFKRVTLGGETKKLYNEDSAFLLYDGASEASDGQHRFADEQQSWIYGFDLGGAVTSATITVKIDGDLLLSVSKDGIHWTDLSDEKVNGLLTKTFSLDADFLNGNTDKLYVRFADRTPSNGFGGQCSYFELTYLGGGTGAATKAEFSFTDISVTEPATTTYQVGEKLSLDGLVVKPSNGDDEIDKKYLSIKIDGGYYDTAFTTAGQKTVEIRYGDMFKQFTITVTADEDPDEGTIIFTPTQEGEKAYLHDDHGSGTGEGKRWADQNSSFIYKFDKASFGKFTAASFTLDIENEYKVEISFDANEWIELASVPKTDRAVQTYDLEEYLEGNEGVIYLRISDSDTSNGFGGCLYKLTFNYTMEEQE